MELQLLPIRLTGRLTGRLPIVVTALTLALSSALGSPGPVDAADPAAQAAAHLSDEHGGAPADYQLVHERTASVPGSNESLWAGKLVGPSGEVFAIYRRSDGTVGDRSVLDQRMRGVAASLEPLANKGDAALQARVAASAPSTSVPVAIWLQADPAAAVEAVSSSHPEVEWIDGRPLVSDLDQARALRAELYDARSDVYAAAGHALTKAVKRLGGTVAYLSASAPIAFVDLPASATDALAALPMVESLGLERTWTPTMTSAGPSVDANWTTGTGDQGRDVRVAVVEYHNVRKTGDLTGRVVASHSSTGTLAYTSGSTFDHPTWVAGAIAGRGTTYTGVAPGARIVSAGTGGGGAGLTRDRAVIATTDWAIAPTGGDADIVSVSLIQDTNTGSEEARRYFDSVVDEDLRLVVAASGNYSAAATWRVGSPGTGWNVLTVGGTDDRNTAGRGDDRIWYVPGANGSSYLDQPGTSWNQHGDFNKPNLSAPAVSVRTANGLGASGTSVATQIVSGIAAQILANAPGLTSWPEATRAVLMAGAVHRTNMPNGGQSADHEGVGTASAHWANRLLVAADGTYGGYRLGSMGGTFSQQIRVGGKQRVRVVVSWNSRTSGTSNLSKADTLASDLDLRLRLPNGTVVGSFSFDNNYEVIDVVSPTAGTATIEVVGTRVGSGGERYGLAWAKIGGDVTAPKVTVRAPESNEPWAAARSTPTVTFSEQVGGFSSSSVQLRPAGGSPLSASLSYRSSARRLTITPSVPLAPGIYQVNLTSGIQDLVGHGLAPMTWSFTVVGSVAARSSAISPTRRVIVSAGTYTAYKFDPAGRVTSSRIGSLDSVSGARANRRGIVAAQPGRWLRMDDGMWAGYWLRESSRVRIAGAMEHQALPATTRVTFAAGSHTGYRFASTGAVTAHKAATLPGTSGANTTGRAVINGSWYLFITNGVWANYWIPESSRSYLRGMVDHRDLANATVRFANGTHTGHRFAADGSVLSGRTAALASSSSAPAVAWALVNGAPRYLIGAGVWAGYWVAEGSRIHEP